MIFGTIYKGSTIRYSVEKIRFLRPDVAIVSLRQYLQFKEGGVASDLEARPTIVAEKRDGTWQIVNFCRHHEDYACQVHAEERRRQGSSLPEPAPNAGGLLPCYFPWRAWEQTYRDAEPGWKVPALGIKADDWPVLAKVTAAEPPKLIALDGKGESVAGMPRGDAPSLRLIRQTP